MVVESVQVVDHRIRIRQGKTWKMVVVFKDNTNTVVNLTQSGYVARMQVRAPATVSTPQIDLDSAGKGGITLNSSGEITMTVGPTVLSSLTDTLIGEWELELDTPGSETLPIVGGEAVLEVEIVK